MGVCTSSGKGTSGKVTAEKVTASSGKGTQSASRETTRSLMSSWNSLYQRGTNLSASEFKKRNSIGRELLKRAVDGSSNSASYEKGAGGTYDVNLGPNNPSYRIGSNIVSVTSESDGMIAKVKEFANPDEAVKFVDRQIKRIKGNRK